MTAGLECSSCGRVYNPTADALRASLAAAEEKLAEAEKHADALAEHMQSLQDAGYEFHALDNCERVDALLAAHAARRAGTTAVEREEGKR